MTTFRAWLPWLSAAALPLALAAPAFAAEQAEKGPSVAIFLGQIIALVVSGRLIGEVMLRLGQPAVMGQLIAGLALGPSLFGALLPGLHDALFPNAGDQKAMLNGVAQFGVLLLLLSVGMETDLKLVRQTGRASLFASLMGILIPFLCGIALGEVLPDSMLPDPGKRIVTSLFLGTALSIASVNFVAMIIREMNFTRRLVGQVILASAIIDDSIGWIIVSIIFSIAAHGSVEALPLAESVIGTLAFLVVSLTLGRRAVFFVIRWTNDTFESEFAVITAIIGIMGAMSLITYSLGVHTVLGAFVAGVLVGESPILTRHIGQQLHGLIAAFFAPVFFGLAGQSANLTVLAQPMIALFTVGLVLVASLGKFGGAFLGGKFGGLTGRESLALACGMNARGSTEVIIATVGLSMGVLNPNLFTMIVAMAVLTTTVMPPTLRAALARIPLRKQEKERLEREEQEAKGFVANLERLLIAVDDSNNGKFVARVAGMLAGTRAMPATVMHIQDPSKIEAKPPAKDENEALARGEKADKKPSKDEEDTKTKKEEKADKRAAKKAEHTGEVVKEAAEQIKANQKEEEKASAPVDVTTIVHEAPNATVIAEEAKKGYDLLAIGLDDMLSKDKTEFAESVTGIALGFEGPLLVSDVRNSLEKSPNEDLSILVPVNGTDVARRGAEVAITISRACKAQLTVLYVAQRGSRKAPRSRRYEEAILKDIVAIADGYNMSVRTAVLSERAADEAILREVERRKHNLIVVGVGRRPGDKLFFGDTAAALLEKSKSSVLFLAS